MRSSCSSRGASVYLTFKQGTDMSIAYREVRDRVERAKLRFPDDVERAYVNKMDMTGIPVCMIGIAYETDGDLYDLVNKHIIMPLSRIDGVANIDTKGLKEKEIIIEANKDRTEAYGLNIYRTFPANAGRQLHSGQWQRTGWWQKISPKILQ